MITVTALYKFTPLKNIEELKEKIYTACVENDIKGTLLLANEGINGTIAGPEQGIQNVLAYLKDLVDLKDEEHKESWSEEYPFYRMKVRLKKEIVTIGLDDVDPNKIVGTYVDPEEWNAIISDPETVLIDTRNDYEVGIGTFKGAIDPKTNSFREFPEYIEKNFDPKKHKKVAMFCTGGIRCEKASSYMKKQGFENVYHLKGGILKYLENVPQDQSMWEGDCFVFDQRVAVGHGLEVSGYDQCFACRRPITEKDKDRPEYMKGVSCHQCIDEMTDDQRERFAMRQKQIALAKERGETHIGDERDVKGTPKDEA
jgi:UPF0176 protein